MAERHCLRPAEYARERKVSVRTVYRLIHAGRFRRNASGTNGGSGSARSSRQDRRRQARHRSRFSDGVRRRTAHTGVAAQPSVTRESREVILVDVDGYLTDEGWTADIRLPWENFAEPELRRPHPAVLLANHRAARLGGAPVSHLTSPRLEIR